MEALAKEVEPGYFLTQSKLGLARVYLTRGNEGDLENAQGCAEEAIAFCQKLQLAGSAPRGYAYLGQAHWLLGHQEAALQNCREAVRLLNKQKKVHGSEVEIYLMAIHILAENGLEREQGQCLEQAYKLVQSTAAKIEAETLRQSYLAVPINREIVEIWQFIFQDK
jgi:tetratricopeptide (TPR) repeat protein